MASLFVADKQNIPHVSRNTQFAVTSCHGKIELGRRANNLP